MEPGGVVGKKHRRWGILLIWGLTVLGVLCFWPVITSGEEQNPPHSLSAEAAYAMGRTAFPVEGGWLVFSTDGERSRAALVGDDGAVRGGSRPSEVDAVYTGAGTDAHGNAYFAWNEGGALRVSGADLKRNRAWSWDGMPERNEEKDLDLVYHKELSCSVLRYFGTDNVLYNFQLDWGKIPSATDVKTLPEPFSGILLPDGGEAPDPASSEGASSEEPDSSAPPVSSEPLLPSGGGETVYHRYNEPVTVAQLQEEFRRLGQPGELWVRTRAGYLMPSGAVGTGCSVSVVLDGEEMNSVTVVVAGDLTGSGKPDSKSLKVFYPALAYGNFTDLQKRAADLNGDGEVTAADLLLLKKRIAYGGTEDNG